MLPPGVTHVTNIKGDKGDTGSINYATVELLPWGETPTVEMVGPEVARGAKFNLPMPLPTPETVSNDDANEALLKSPTKTKAAVESIVDFGTGLVNTSPRPERPRVLSHLLVPRAGHGWSGVDVTGFALAGVVGPVAGSIIRFATDPGTPTGYIQKSGLGLDAQGAGFLVWLGLSHPTETTVKLRAGNAGMTDYWEWTLTESGVNVGKRIVLTSSEYVPITLNFASAVQVGSPSRAAIDTMRVYSTSTGGTNRQTRIGGISLIDEQQGGMVSFTFDDTWKEHFTVAAPMLEARGYRGTFYTIIDPVVQGYGSYMSLEDLHALQDAGHEIASHASSISAHSTGFDAMGRQQLVDEIRKIKGWLAEHGFRGLDHLAFPMGRSRPQDADIYRHFFASARATTGFQHETMRPGDPMRLRCLYVHQDTTVAEVTAAIAKCKAEGSWLILCLHKLKASPVADDEWQISNLQEVVDYCWNNSVRVGTVGDAISGQFRGLA